MTAAARRGAVAQRPPIVVAVPEDPEARLAFTGRTVPETADGNVSLLVGGGDVAGARAAGLAVVGAGPDDAVFMAQVHGGEVALVGSGDRGRGARSASDAVPGVDGLVTAEAGVALAVLVADCVPVLLVDPGAAVGAVHAGRRGVTADIVERALAVLSPDGPERVVAVVGPAIGGCCYEVPAPLAEQVADQEPTAAATTSWGTPALDLPAAVVAQLGRAGVRRVEQVGACTRCEAGSFFSHRADTATPGGPVGRQAGLVVRGRAGGPHERRPSPTGTSASPAPRIGRLRRSAAADA